MTAGRCSSTCWVTTTFLLPGQLPEQQRRNRALPTPQSWVARARLSASELEERFPGGGLVSMDGTVIRSVRRCVAFGLATIAMAALLWPAAQTDQSRALALYQQTQYRQALELAERAEPKSATTYALIGQSHYGL